MSKKLRELQARKADQVKSARALTNQADAEGRDLTDDEVAKFNAISSQIEATNAAIDRENTLIAEEAQIGTNVGVVQQITTHDRREDDPKRGFKNFGEFAASVRSAELTKGRNLDERLLIGAAAPTTFGNEGSGSDGGFVIPAAFSTDIFTHALGEDSLVPLTDNTLVSGNSMVFPKDETTPWGTDGIRAYWQGEALAGNQTKPKLSTSTLRLYKLMALVPVTDELLDDTTALTSYLPSKVADSIRWKLNEAILFGLGNGTPIGAYQGNAAVTVAKEGGQATQTLQAINLAKMIARLPAGSFGRAIWLINNDVLPALFTLTLGNYPIYLPGAANGGLQNSPYGSLLGRPIVISQHAKSFSSQGDIMLIDPKYYRTITKTEGFRTDTSAHLYFDADATAFRTTFRIDGGPKIVNPIAPANGASTLSPFIQLGAR